MQLAPPPGGLSQANWPTTAGVPGRDRSRKRAGEAGSGEAAPASPARQARNRDRTGDLILTKDVLYRLSYACTHEFCPLPNLLPTALRAGDGARTRDIKLGRLALYQLSYSRKHLLSSMVGEGFEPSKA